jgi:hypothetical protein
MRNYRGISILLVLICFAIISLVFNISGFNEILPYITVLIVLVTNSFLYPLIGGYSPFKGYDISLKANEKEEKRLKVTEGEIFLAGVIVLTNYRILYYRFGSILTHNLKREDTQIKHYKYQGFFSQKSKVIIEHPTGTFTCYAQKEVGVAFVNHTEEKALIS